MKVLCKVNNYQYGMAQFEAIREQYAYQEELVEGKWHQVWLEFDPSQVNFGWLKKLLNGRVIVL